MKRVNNDDMRTVLNMIHRAVEFASFEAVGGRVDSPGGRFYLWYPLQDLLIKALNADASGRRVYEALREVR